MDIPVLFEPTYLKSSVWCKQIQSEMESFCKNRKYKLLYIDGESYPDFDYDTLFGQGPRLLAIVSTTKEWLKSALSFFERISVSVVLGDCYPNPGPIVRGQVSFDYSRDVQTILSYLSDACGCKSTALYGAFSESSADGLKKEAFLAEQRKRGIENPDLLCFDNEKGLVSVYETFKSSVSKFDSVICVNDMAALCLEKAFAEDGIRVPDEIQVVSFGSTKLSETANPPITLLYLDNPAIGKNVVLAYRYLMGAESDSVTAGVKIAGKLIVRKSTEEKADLVPAIPEKDFEPISPNGDFYRDGEVLALSRLEQLLLDSDDFDLALLRAILEKESADRIAESFHISRSAVFYRIRRFEDTLGVSDLPSLRRFLSQNRFDQMIGEPKK